MTRVTYMLTSSAPYADLLVSHLITVEDKLQSYVSRLIQDALGIPPEHPDVDDWGAYIGSGIETTEDLMNMDWLQDLQVAFLQVAIRSPDTFAECVSNPKGFQYTVDPHFGAVVITKL